MDKLTEIIATKRREIATRLRPMKDEEFLSWGRNRKGRRGFIEALREPQGLGVIAEIKRKSPSAGTIAAAVDPAEQARLYYNAGADCISVLTDEPYFGGSIRDLWEVNDLLLGRPDGSPTLRKDFFIHPIQVLEAAEAGAACILIIARALEVDEMKVLDECARAAGLDSLFEIHDEAELEKILPLNPRMIGINNRDLKRFTTDLAISENLLPKLPESALAVSESGIWTLEDAERVWSAGAEAILVGEALMRMEDPEPFVSGVHAFTS